MMNWRKLGQIYTPAEGPEEWRARGYAAVPVRLPLAPEDGTGVRVFYSARDSQGRSRIGWLDFDPAAPHHPPQASDGPVIAPGPPGSFDEAGTMATELIYWQGRWLLYYIGWNLTPTVPFRNALGVAVNRAPDRYPADFVRLYEGPVLDRSIYDPAFVASCGIFPEQDFLRLYYLSCLGWFRQADGSYMHRYHLKYAESNDGIHFQRRGHVAIDFAYENEYAISVPVILKDNGTYKMWFSYRGGPWGDTYRIGYAESADGLTWQRQDEAMASLQPGEPGSWDSEMLCYPEVFDYQGRRYMLYNGNGYGRTGIGLAVQEA